MRELGHDHELDAVLELEVGRRAVAVRHVPHTLDVFATHFPRFPVLPGVLILDDLARVARLAVTSPAATTRVQVWTLAAARRVRYRHFVQPGDTLELVVTVTELSGTRAVCQAVARVDGRPVTTVQELVLQHVEEDAA